MGKRNANPREGDPGLAEKALGKDFKPEVSEKDQKKARVEERIPKKKLELPEEPAKPDDAAFEKQKKAIEEELDGLNAEFKAASASIDERQTDKEGYNAERQKLRDALDEAQKTVDDLFTDYNGVVAKVREAKDLNRKAKMELRDMNRDVEALDEVGIDNKIRQLEYDMSVKTMSLKDEKAQMKLIAELRKQKPKIIEKTRKLEDLQRQTDDTGDVRKPLAEQADELREKLNVAKEAKREKAMVLKELREKREKETEGVREFIEKKKEVRGKIDEKRDAIRALRNDHKAVKDAHYDWKRACQKLKNDAWKADEDLRWEIWRADDKKEALSNAAERPHFEETTLIEQTLEYCRDLIGDKKDKEEAKQDDIDFSAFGFPEGARVCVPKKDRDADEGAVMLKKGKKLRQKTKATTKSIKHNAGTFALFKQLDIDAPLTLEAVPDVMEALNKKAETFQAKIKEWELKREQMQKEVDETEAKKKVALEAAAKDAE